MSTGRPSKYRVEFDEQARKLALLGLKDAEIAEYFEVTESTLNNWKIGFPSFLESLNAGKLMADADVSEKLYQRALGYSHPAVKIMQHEGQVMQVPYIEHYPPDTKAAELWLRNRQSARWRDAARVDVSGTVTVQQQIEERLDNILDRAKLTLVK